MSNDGAKAVPQTDASADEEAALKNEINGIDGNFDATIGSLRPLKPMQAFLSTKAVETNQKHRQRPAKESTALPENNER